MDAVIDNQLVVAHRRPTSPSALANRSFVNPMVRLDRLTRVNPIEWVLMGLPVRGWLGFSFFFLFLAHR